MAKIPTKAINTPKGELNWVFASGEGKEDLNGNKRFTAAIYFQEDDPAIKKFQAEVDAYWNEHKPKSAKKPKSNGIYFELKEKGSDRVTTNSITQPYDTDEYVKTGRIVVQAWTTTINRDGSPKKIKTYNAKGSEVSLGSKHIGNGTIGKLAVSAGVYEQGTNCGVTLFLNGIQIIKFVEFTAGANFDAVDDDDAFTGIEGDFDTIEDTSEAAPTTKVRL